MLHARQLVRVRYGRQAATVSALQSSRFWHRRIVFDCRFLCLMCHQFLSACTLRHLGRHAFPRGSDRESREYADTPEVLSLLGVLYSSMVLWCHLSLAAKLDHLNSEPEGNHFEPESRCSCSQLKSTDWWYSVAEHFETWSQGLKGGRRPHHNFAITSDA